MPKASTRSTEPNPVFLPSNLGAQVGHEPPSPYENSGPLALECLSRLLMQKPEGGSLDSWVLQS